MGHYRHNRWAPREQAYRYMRDAASCSPIGMSYSHYATCPSPRGACYSRLLLQPHATALTSAGVACGRWAVASLGELAAAHLPQAPLAL
jgi:hypothetical protein